jgi:hypothetical protein
MLSLIGRIATASLGAGTVSGHRMIDAISRHGLARRPPTG